MAGSAEADHMRRSRGLVDALAASVVDALARDGVSGKDQLQRSTQSLYCASIGDRPFRAQTVYDRLPRARRSDNEFLESIVAAVACMLGEDWLNDRLGFFEVSLASANIFSFLKMYTSDQQNDAATGSGMGLLLTAVSPESHLIGPTILAQKLRRAGHDVTYFPNAEAEEITSEVRHRSYDGLMISCGSLEGVARTNAAIERMFRMGLAGPRVIVGGACLNLPGENVQFPQADLVTNSIEDALALLEASKQRMHGAA